MNKNNKLLCSFIVIIFIMMPGFTIQTTFAQPFEGGFSGGFVASQVDGDARGGYDKFGITLGGYLTLDHLTNTRYKAELRYTQKGSAERPTENDPSYYRLVVHYIEIPFLYQYHFQEKIWFEGGITPDIYLADKEEDETGVINEGVGPEYHRLGINGELGIIYQLTDRISVGMRFSHSLLAMRDHPGGQVYYFNRGQYHKLFHFSAYFHFD